MTHVTLDKNFRLTPSVRPARYDFSVRLFPETRTFEGSGTVSLVLDEQQDALLLHGIGLEVTSARVVVGGEPLSATDIVAHAESETLTFRFPRPLRAGEAQLHLQWQGSYNEGLRGMYLADDVSVTQFEAADARRVFPLFDEPAFKARWKLKVEAPAAHTVLGNGAVLREQREGDRKWVEFAETEVLSSYLVALTSGILEGSDVREAGGTPIRTWAVPSKAALTDFAQEVAQAVLPRLQTYFGLPYAFGKVDQVGIPNFEAGAMENAGLITYRETALLLDRATASLGVKKRVAEVITHELAHHWFGNWVTMVWWDDLWLNEAFATWMAYKIVDEWKPEWRIWVDFDNGKSSALFLDALQSTHPIRGDVFNAHQATENFDLITYEKGGAVLRMIESYLGEEKFRDGIRLYMKRFARGNAVADDLWMALEEASHQPVVELANAWIRQPGYPLVSVERHGSALRLTQSRFFSAPGVTEEQTWPVPIVLRFEDDAGIHEQRVLLRDREAQVALDSQGELRWVCANAGSTGFYRADYDAPLRARLGENLAKLEVTERMGLLGDAWALFRAGRLEIGPLLDLLVQFKSDTDYPVLDDLVGRLSAIDYRLVADADQPRFRKFVAGLLRPQWDAVGWEPRTGEPDAERLRRAALLRGLGLVAREPSLLGEARARVEKVLAGDKAALEANLQDATVTLVARAGDVRMFDALLAAYRQESDPAFKRRYLSALAAFEQAEGAERAREMLFSDAVPLQDLSGFFAGLMSNPSTRSPLWGTLQSRFGAVLERSKSAPMIQRRIIEAMGALREDAELEAFRGLLQKHPLPEQRQGIAQTLERLEQDVALRRRATAGIARWLDSHAEKGS